MENQLLIPKKYLSFLVGILVFWGLYLTSLHHYLLFHSLAEIFSIVVACGIFMITWNSRRFLDNNYLLFIGIAFLFVGGLDLIHTLAYKGMGVFQGYETNLPTQLWIAARYTESISLLIAPLVFSRKLKTNLVLLGYALAISILLLSIFYLNIFPVCFIEGVGLTLFKKISEYIISLILLASIGLLLKNRRKFDRAVLQWLVWSIIVTIASELAFTFYIDAYGFSNLIGHFSKIVSFYLIYKAIIETGLTRPYALLFRNLKQSEERFRNIFEKSPFGIELYDSVGQLVDINKSRLEMFGVSDVEKVKGFKLLQDPNLSEEVKENLKRGEVVRFEAHFDFEKVKEHKLYETTRSGVSYLDVLITPLGAGQEEDQSGYLVQVQDITERKKAEEETRRLLTAIQQEKERLSALVNSINDEVWFADTQRRFTLANPSAVSEFGLSSTDGIEVETLAKGLEVCRSDGSPRPVEEAPPLRALKGEILRNLEEIIRTPASGELRYRQVSAAPVTDPSGNIIGSVSVVRDITERKRMEEELRRSRDKLEIRIQERTAELTSVVAALQDEMAERKQAEEALQKANYDLNERIKEINCLYSISYYVDKQYLLLEEKLKNIVDLIPSGWQYPEITCARVILEGKEYKTDNFKETAWKQSSDIIVHDESIGTMEVCYLEERTAGDKKPFLKEERNLINTIAIELGEMIAHMRAEKALVEQSRILETFFTSTIAPFVFLDKNFNYVRVNEAYAKACQRETSEFPGHNHFEFYPSGAKALFEHVVETKTPYQAIARPFTFPDHPEWGETYWDWTLTPILDDAGEVGYLVFSLRDVTKRKRAEEAVKTERQRFNDVLEILPAYLVLLAPDYQVPFANRFFRERFGESQGRRCFEYLFDRSEPCETCESYTALTTMAPHKWEWIGPDGRNYDVFDFPFTDTDGSTLVLEMGIDITERKRAEEAVRAASLYTRSLIEASLDPLVTISADGKIMDVNRATELVTGVSREQLIGTDFSNYFTEPEKAREGYQQVFQTGLVWDYPLAIRDSSGRITEVLYNATIYKNEAGEVQGVFAAARDITELKRTQDALKAASLYTRSLIEASLDPLVTISADGKIMDVNSATELTTGFPRDELIGTDFSEYFTEPKKAKQGYQRVFREGLVRDYPLAIQHTSGKVTDVLYHATVFRNETGVVQGVFAAARDITVRKELQRRIEATNALLNLFVRTPSRKEYVDAALGLIQNWSSCRCAGIRVLNEKDHIPYESYRGFSSQFWESENLLSVKYDQCACTRVMTGNPDPQDHPRMTPAGSFWCDNIFEFVGNLSEEEKTRFRGVCVQNGFKSVAIIPIRYREKILGAIHLADEREGIVPVRSIEFIESMAPLIGEAINRFNLEEEIKESEARMRHLSTELLNVQENERKRISREIHDGLGQTLTAIKFSLESKLSQIGKRKAPPGITLENIISLAGSGIEEARRIQMDLRPSILDDLGILATIGWFTREFQKVYSHISIEKKIDIAEEQVPDPLKTVLFRVMQEALNNISKHSKADLIRISLRKLGDQIELMIEDNGVGFELESIKKGLGLTSMRERTELSRGSLKIESTPGKGTTIRAEWHV